jgi:signal transduction histidine kinase/putative methionine-R-sulfoxide reductase with GAF domain
VERLELLYNISRKLGSSLDLDKVLSDILALTIPSVGATSGSIIVLDESGQARRHVLIKGELATPVTEQVVARVLDKGLAGWVVRRKEGTIVFDTKDDQRWLALTDDHLATRSAIAVPLLRQERVIGALTLSHSEPSRFAEEHLDLLLSIANQAAIAVENARLYEKVTERMREATALYKVSNLLMRTLNLDQLLKQVLDILQKSFGYLDCAILLVDEQAEELEVKAARGYLQETAGKVRLKTDQESIVNWVVAHKTALNVPDVSRDSRYIGTEKTRSEMAVPMMAGDRVIGVLDVQRSEVNGFNEDDLRVLSSVAAQAAIAVERAWLYSAERRRVQESLTLLAIAQALSSTLDLTEVLKLVACSTAQACHANRCSILLLSQDRKELVPLMSQFASGEVDRELWAIFKERYAQAADEFPIIQEVIRKRKPVILDGPAMSVMPQEWIEPFGIFSLLMVPLISKDEVIGLMALDHVEEGRHFTDEQVNLAITIGTHAVMAIENARLHSTIAEERAKLEAIIGGTNDAVIVTDAQNRVLLINQAAQSAFDVETMLEVGKPLEEVVSNERLLALFARPEAMEEVRTEEIPLSDGRTLYASLTPVAEVGRITVMQDITYLKELDKMKSDFVATVSHDLRSPLSNVSGYASLLPEAGELNETQEEFVERIKASVKIMITLINNLLDLGKIEAKVEMEVKPCQLVTVINQAVESLKQQAKAKEIVLQLDLPPELPLIQGNQVRLDQVVSNLIGNAIKFTPERGMVTVSGRGEKGEVVVEVKDTGIGIAPEDQIHLFEKFYRVRSRETSGIEGTGLGLAIVKSIVEGHGGRVWVKSQLGKGSTFGFALPLP